MNTVEYGPLVEETMLTSRLDYYKATMSQLEFEKFQDVDGTFTFKNRGEQRIEDYLSPDELQDRLDMLREHNWQQTEIDYFASLTDTEGNRVFSDPFLTHLLTEGLPPVEVTHDERLNDIAIQATGDIELVTFWETVIMSEVNEGYFENLVRAEGIDLMELYDEADRRLSEKIEILQANPEIKIADFGTRRHFSLRWHRHVLQRLSEECPENFIGTSNIAFANTLQKKPIGTFAHELPMLYAGVADAQGKDIRASHHQMLNDWIERYPHLGIALTDTFTSDFFFVDFTTEQAIRYQGGRHDSGDPTEFGERLIEFYKEKGIDPTGKTIVFSDGLDIDQIVTLHNHFKGRINIAFGWGTTLTNDMGLDPLSIVAKLTHVETANNEADTVKLSDNPGKHTGPIEKIAQYVRIFTKIKLGATALAA